MGWNPFRWNKKSSGGNRPRVLVDRNAAIAAWRQLPSFHRLVRLIGPNRGEAMIRMCDEYIDGSIQWRGFDDAVEELFCGIIGGFFEYEAQMILDIRQQIITLWGQCENAELRDLLDRNNLPPDQWRIQTNPLEDDLWKGVNWINSHDPSIERRRQTLRLMMKLQRGYDPREKATFETINVDLIGLEGAIRDRITNRGGRYPSTIGGDALAELIEGYAMTTNLVPGDGSRAWDDLACFLYGAYVRAQCAPDGNKRSSRALFIATLRKGGRPIRVPDHALDCILMGPNFAR